MPKLTRDEWLDWLHERRVEIAKLANNDPRKAELQAVLSEFEKIERGWTEIDEYDPDLAAQLANQIARVLKK